MNLLIAAWDLALVVVLVGLCTSVGRLAIRRVTARSSLEDLLFSLGAGIGVVGTLLLVVGILGFAGDAGLLSLLIGLAAVSWTEIRRLPSLVIQAFKEAVADWSAAELAIVGIIAVFMFAHAALPPTDYDSLAYHLAVPELYLREGRVFLPPDLLHAAYVGVFHMLYLPLLAFGSGAGPALLNSVIALALMPLVYLIGDLLFDGRTGRFAAVLVWAAPVLFLVAVTPRVDVTLLWYLVLGHYVILRVLRDPTNLRSLWLGGLFLGIAFAVKQSALLYIVALGPVLLMAVARGKRADAVPGLVLFGAALILPAAPWLLKNWTWLGDPLYPFLAGHVTEAWLVSLYGGAPPVADIAVPAIRQIRSPFNLIDFFFAPSRLTPEGEGALYFANPVLFFLPLALLGRQWQEKLWLAFPALLYAGGLYFLQRNGTNLRYWIPAVVPLAIVSVGAMTSLLRRRRQLFAAIILLLPLAASLVLLTAIRQVWPYLSGQLSAEEYLEIRSNGEIRSYLNQQTPPASRVLMLFDSRVHRIDRSVIPDAPRTTNWLEIAPAAARGCLAGSGITHIMVSQTHLSYQASRGLDLTSVRWDEFPAFASRCLDLVDAGYGHRIYRLRT